REDYRYRKSRFTSRLGPFALPGLGNLPDREIVTGRTVWRGHLGSSFCGPSALIAAASCSRRSGERLSFLFTFLGADPCAPGGFTCDFAVELGSFSRAPAARVDFFFAFAALALTKAASFPFSLASFFGPSCSRVSRRRIFFFRVLSFITRSGWHFYIGRYWVDFEFNDRT